MTQDENDSVDAAQIPEAPEQSATDSRGAGANRIAVLLLLVMFAAAGGLYWWMDQRHRAVMQESTKQFDALIERFDRLSGELDGVTERYAALTGEQAGLDARLKELTAAVSELYSESGGGDLYPVLAEIEYLLIIASQRLLLERDVKTAVAALRSADERLRTLSHPDLLGLRQHLIADLNSLQAVTLPDLEGHALYLADLIGRVGELPLRPLEFEPENAEPSEAGGAGQEGASSIWVELWRELVSIVDVERLDVPDAVLVDPTGRRLLYDGVRLELISARISVLRRDTDNMQASIGIVERLLSQYFDPRDPAAANILDTLQQMQAVQLAPELPTVTGSLNAVRALRAKAQ